MHSRKVDHLPAHNAPAASPPTAPDTGRHAADPAARGLARAFSRMIGALAEDEQADATQPTHPAPKVLRPGQPRGGACG